MGLGGRGVDGHDAGVRVGAAQDGPVEHAGKLDVVEVVALAPQEPGVLLAQHAAEADGVARCADGRLALGGGHAVTSSSSAGAVSDIGFLVRSPPGVFGRPADGAHDVLVAGAAAELARDHVPDLGLGRIGVAVEQPAGGHQHARGAEAALQAVALHEALLERVELAALVQVLDGADGAAVGHGGQHGAALDRLAVHPQHARAAVGGVAAPVGAGQAQVVAHEVHEQQPGLDLAGHLGPVDGHRHLHVRHLLLVHGPRRAPAHAGPARPPDGACSPPVPADRWTGWWRRPRLRRRPPGSRR